MGGGLRTLCVAVGHVAADGPGAVRAHAFVRGAGEPAQQPGHRNLLRGRQGDRFLLRAEPFLCAVRRPFSGRFGIPHPARRA